MTDVLHEKNPGSNKDIFHVNWMSDHWLKQTNILQSVYAKVNKTIILNYKWNQ